MKTGDSIKVKPGTRDPNLDLDLSGWQGWVIEVYSEENDRIVWLQWDSMSLKTLDREGIIEESIIEGYEWSEMYLSLDDVEKALARDTVEASKALIKELAKKYEWSDFGAIGTQIQRVLAGHETADEMQVLSRWESYLLESLHLPAEGYVYEFQERGPFRRGERVTIKSIEFLDDKYGIIAHIEKEREPYDIVLCDLAATEEDSQNGQAIEAYRVWFANS